MNTDSPRILEPGERISEALFGLIMVLTFTGSLSVVNAGRADVGAMLIGALGCNLAWGIIDGILYLMGCLGEQGRSIRSLRALQEATTPDEAHRAIAGALPPMVAAALDAADYETLRRKLVQLPPAPRHASLDSRAWLGALAVFLWVFVMTLPVALPFAFIDDIRLAMRVSNAVAVALLFLCGVALGRAVHHRPWLTGIGMVALGAALVGLTIKLGG